MLTIRKPDVSTSLRRGGEEGAGGFLIICSLEWISWFLELPGGWTQPEGRCEETEVRRAEG
jgi:hypothetical protein